MQDSQKDYMFFVFFSLVYRWDFLLFHICAKKSDKRNEREKEKSQAMNGEPTGKKCGIRTCRSGNRKDLLQLCHTLDSSKVRHCRPYSIKKREEKKTILRACSCVANVSTLPQINRAYYFLPSFLVFFHARSPQVVQTPAEAAFSKYASQQRNGGSVSSIQFLDQQLTDNQVEEDVRYAPQHRLSGCKNDLAAIHKYVIRCC